MAQNAVSCSNYPREHVSCVESSVNTKIIQARSKDFHSKVQNANWHIYDTQIQCEKDEPYAFCLSFLHRISFAGVADLARSNHV